MNHRFDISIVALDAFLTVHWDESGGETKEEFEARLKDAEGKFVYRADIKDLSNQKRPGYEGVLQKACVSPMFLPEAAPQAFRGLTDLVEQSIQAQMKRIRETTVTTP